MIKEVGKTYLVKITQAEKPVIFKKICDIYKVVIPESEAEQVDALDLLVDTSGSKEDESAGIVETLGQDGGSDD